MLAGLCEAIDARPYMRGHGARVGELAEAIALRLGWGAGRIRRLRIGALLHDVGKLAVADPIWHKAERLTEQEFDAIRRHPAAGMRILARQLDFRFAIPQVLFHHERWDGRGYPARRGGEAIPLEARVLAVADAYDAMTSPRPYRPALPPLEAVAEIDRCAGSQFDPVVAGVFVELSADEAPRPAARVGSGM
jgi:HD-GYP domain-containing protein (c-di-GMP phosphodiesterase class II)